MAKRTPVQSFIRDFTAFGNAYIALLVVAFTTQDVDVVFRVALGLLVIYFLGFVIERILFKERPGKRYKHIFNRVASGSFPSLHVARSSFAYSFLFEYLDYPFTVIPIILILVVAASRVYLKEHYIVDTIFGLFFGLSVFYLFKILL